LHRLEHAWRRRKPAHRRLDIDDLGCDLAAAARRPAVAERVSRGRGRCHHTPTPRVGRTVARVSRSGVTSVAGLRPVPRSDRRGQAYSVALGRVCVERLVPGGSSSGAEFDPPALMSGSCCAMKGNAKARPGERGTTRHGTRHGCCMSGTVPQTCSRPSPPQRHGRDAVRAGVGRRIGSNLLPPGQMQRRPIRPGSSADPAFPQTVEGVIQEWILEPWASAAPRPVRDGGGRSASARKLLGMYNY
jgi:hypothetical protein